MQTKRYQNCPKVWRDGSGWHENEPKERLGWLGHDQWLKEMAQRARGMLRANPLAFLSRPLESLIMPRAPRAWPVTQEGSSLESSGTIHWAWSMTQRDDSEMLTCCPWASLGIPGNIQGMINDSKGWLRDAYMLSLGIPGQPWEYPRHNQWLKGMTQRYLHVVPGQTWEYLSYPLSMVNDSKGWLRDAYVLSPGIPGHPQAALGISELSPEHDKWLQGITQRCFQVITGHPWESLSPIWSFFGIIPMTYQSLRFFPRKSNFCWKISMSV